ncbi:hypothetical protein MG293_015871 [Ovis ammon polii]|uniref:Ig-like domain-containing protein n=1 Tax=Ovis ammon polii TaxID=230172 RepID=A0AAD4TX95_OVIAM|nr:hypothetical protein MG293_015871 [Ovis ammon polii]
MSFALYREGEAAPLQYRDSEQPWADFPLLGARAPGTYTCYYHTPSAPYVLSARSEPLVVRADGYLRKPSLQAHRSGAVTEGQEVTLQCQRPATELGPVMFALLKAGSAAPVQVRPSAGRETDFSLLSVSAGDSGNYSCAYYQARAPFLASQASPRLEIRVAGEKKCGNPRPLIVAQEDCWCLYLQSLLSAPGHSEVLPMSFHGEALRTIGQAALKTTYLTQMGVGALGKAILLFHNIAPVLPGHSPRPPHTILTHMALANLLFLLSSGVTYTMAAFVLGNPLSSLGWILELLGSALELLAGILELLGSALELLAGEIKCGNPRPLVIAQDDSWCLYLQRLLSAPRHSEVLPMSLHGEALRTIGQAALKTTYLTQMGDGALGNAILLFHNIAPGLLAHSPRPPHTILTHMALANLLFLLSSGVPYTMAAFVLGHPLSSLGWRLVLLSSPSAGTVVLWSTSDAVFIGLVVWSSGSSVLLLHRHHQRVRYIHTPTGHHRCPPETTAARTILMLVVTFVIFYVDTLDILSMFFHKDALRTTSQAALKITYLTQMGIGSLVNVILFFHSISLVLIGQSQRPTDMIHTHMAVANLLVLLSPGIAHTMAASFPRKPLSGLGCKFVYYVQRVARSTTLCSTCVLSTYQSFTLTPRRAEWVVLRGRAPKVIGPSCCTCWILSFIMHIIAPLKITGPPNMHNYTDTKDKWFCSSSPDEIVSSDDKTASAELVEAVSTRYNNRYHEIRHHWGGRVLGPKSVAPIAKVEKARVKEQATKLG